MLNLISEIGQAAARALKDATGSDAVPAELPVQAAARPEFGDLQIAACLQLAKPLSRKPRDLAAIIQAALAGHAALERVELAGPGYVNLYLRTSWLEERITALRGDPALGLRQALLGQTIVVDFSSPNVAKPMHIAHIRSTIIGDALQRVLRALGARVISDNHLGDWGTQFGKLIVAYRRWLDQGAFQRAPITELVRLYQRFVAEEAAQAQELGLLTGKPADDDEQEEADERAEGPKGTPLLQEARAELAKLQKGDAANVALWREFVEVSLREFKRSYDRLGVVFDEWLGESAYNDRLPAVVEELLQRGLAERSQGAVICPVEGEPAPLLIQKGDGAFLYGTTDLATIAHRVKSWDPVRVLYVVDSRQQMHFRQVFAVAKKMGVTCSLEHVWFGTMRFKDPDTGQWGTGSTRKGNVPMLEEFLDEALRRARGVAVEKNAELDAADIEEVARVVGLGAVKYNDLSRDRTSDIHFDLDKAMSLEGNTAPYIQYAYARMRSIGRKARDARPAPGEEGGPCAGTAEPPATEAFPGEAGAAVKLGLPAERALARRVLDYPAAVEQVARTARPHQLAEYLYSLAGAVATFYTEVPVLKSAPAERAARLALLDVAAKTLKHGLSLLGIEVLDRM